MTTPLVREDIVKDLTLQNASAVGQEIWMTLWGCHCGKRHAPWWKTTPAPSCRRALR